MTMHPPSASGSPATEDEPPRDEEGDEVLADHPLDLTAGSEADLFAQRQDLEAEPPAPDAALDPEVPEADAIDQAAGVGWDDRDERRP